VTNTRETHEGGAQSRLGRISTSLTAVVVLALTASAIFSSGGMRANSVLRIAVPDTAYYGPSLRNTNQLGSIVARVTGRDVEVVRSGAQWPSDCELYVMPASAFRAQRHSHGLHAVYAFGPSRHRDAAVLIAAASAPAPDLSALEARDFVFGSLRSPNACWQQLRALDGEGVALPATLAGLRFAEGLGDVRVVYSVLFDRYRVGACRESDVLALVASGRIDSGEIRVIRRLPALPEMIFAARNADRAYYKKHLGRLRTALLDPEAAGPGHDAVDLLVSLGVRGVVPVTDAQVSAIDSLAHFVENRFDTQMD